MKTNDAPEKLDKFKYIFKEKYVVNIEKLTKRFAHNTHRVNVDLINQWRDMENDYSMKRHQKYVRRIMSGVAIEAATWCRGQMLFDSKQERDYLMWCRVSASYEGIDGAIKLTEYAVNHEFDKVTVSYWLEKAMELSKPALDNCFTAEEQEEIIQEALKLLMTVGARYASLPLPHIFELLRFSDANRLNVKKKIAKYKDELVKATGGIQVMDKIDYSGDRASKDVCERYRVLTDGITTIVPIQNLNLMRDTLDQEFPWYLELTKKITNNLLIRQLGKGSFFIPPLLILGAAGIGKTSYVKRLAELSGVPHQILSLAGQNDNKYLQGTARGWSSGQPSMPVSLINDSKCANPIVMIDELDKAGGSDHNGRSVDSLLTLFEPSSAKKVFDEFLLGHADLSHITWICTGNDISQMPRTILSRLDVVTVKGPEPEHYPAIIKKSINDFCQRNGLHAAQVPVMTEADWRWFEKYYKTPRVARKAAEKWLAYALLNPVGQSIN
ncbi:MAG: hypothetical protein COB22_05385 [Cycloclasticus sp.]|nr:MAG: hypothetical protein COB22_05385 [Cycloclasticus sp.]